MNARGTFKTAEAEGVWPANRHLRRHVCSTKSRYGCIRLTEPCNRCFIFPSCQYVELSRQNPVIHQHRRVVIYLSTTRGFQSVNNFVEQEVTYPVELIECSTKLINLFRDAPLVNTRSRALPTYRYSTNPFIGRLTLIFRDVSCQPTHRQTLLCTLLSRLAA